MAVHPDVPSELALVVQSKSGLRTLPTVGPACDPATAAETFDVEGFVVVEDALSGRRLEDLVEAVRSIVSELELRNPSGSGNRGLRRYSLGDCSTTRQQIHRSEWAALLDVDVVTEILCAIWGTPDYFCCGAGGELCLPGAIEHQWLHSDVGPHFRCYEKAPFITVNFIIEDQTPFNGPLRIVPRTQRLDPRMTPDPDVEEESSLWSTIFPARAGTAVIRDLRCWHGGTPNISTSPRALPSIDYAAPFMEQELHQRPVLPRGLWEGLSEQGRRVSAALCAASEDLEESHFQFQHWPVTALRRLVPLFEPCGRVQFFQPCDPLQ